MKNFVKIGEKVRCIKNDRMDDHVGIPEDKRWHIGDEFIVVKIEELPYGTFLYNNKGQNLNLKRAAVVVPTY